MKFVVTDVALILLECGEDADTIGRAGVSCKQATGRHADRLHTWTRRVIGKGWREEGMVVV